MHEKCYEEILRSHLDSWINPALAQLTWTGIVRELPENLQAELTNCSVWPWSQQESQVKPDIIIGDEHDAVRMIVELKGPKTAIQWSQRTALRAATPDGPGAKAVAAVHLNPNDPSSAQIWDEPHEDGLGCECYWKADRKNRELHTAVVHQCDCYAYTWDYLPRRAQGSDEPGLVVDPRTPPVFVFLDPGNKRDEFRRNLVTNDLWHVVSLPSVLERWRQKSDLFGLVVATERFLNLEHERW